MILQIKIEHNLYTDALLKQENIPCTVKVSNTFNIIFTSPLSLEIEGVVSEWDYDLLSERVPTGAGGELIYFNNALLTLEKNSDEIYCIKQLSIFDPSTGWCPVIENGEYAESQQFWDNDDEDPDYVPHH